MSEHRRPCQAEPPMFLPWGPEGHEHACIHDAVSADANVPGFVREHKCSCGMTWIERDASQAGQEARP